jgi:hypothetical protein
VAQPKRAEVDFIRVDGLNLKTDSSFEQERAFRFKLMRWADMLS